MKPPARGRGATAMLALGVSTMNPRTKAPGLAAAALLLLGLGCTGQIDNRDRSGDGTNPPNGEGNGSHGGSGGGNMPKPMPGPDGIIDSAGPYALRRLTLLEYSN